MTLSIYLLSNHAKMLWWKWGISFIFFWRSATSVAWISNLNLCRSSLSLFLTRIFRLLPAYLPRDLYCDARMHSEDHPSKWRDMFGCQSLQDWSTFVQPHLSWQWKTSFYWFLNKNRSTCIFAEKVSVESFSKMMFEPVKM